MRRFSVPIILAFALCMVTSISPLIMAAPASQQGSQRSLYLPVITKPGTAPGGPSSDQLIDAALKRGEIDAETALIYHVFATFVDPRLPAKYRGDDSQPSEREIMSELAARFNQLSPQAKATLEPFTIPPYHTGSWWDLRQSNALTATSAIGPAALRCGQTGDDDPLFNQWHYVDSANGMARLWWQARYPDDEQKARDYAKAIDTIWLKLHGLMQRQPPSDEGEDRTCRGGDNRLDISLVDLGHNGVTPPYTFDPVATPSYILLKRSSGISTLTHELMHSFQFAYDVAGSYNEYNWWREATAAWAEHYVDPASNSEHRFAQHFLGAPELPLEFYNLAEEQPGYAHQYGAYLLPLFQQLRSGKPDLARTSWEQFERSADSLAAINALLPGGFREQWPEFTLRNVNQPPVDDYDKADKLPNKARLKLDQRVELQGAPSVAYPLDGNVKHLTAHHFRFAFTDDTVRSVIFENPFAGGTFPTAHVRAVYRVGASQWATEDWTDKSYVTFCRDIIADRVKELFIVISNSEWSDRSHVLKPARAPRLQAINVGCRGWQVEAEYIYAHRGPGSQATIMTTTTATLERYVPPSGRVQVEFYKVTSGTAKWTYRGTKSICTASKDGSYDVRDPAIEFIMIVETYNLPYFPPIVPGSRKYHALGTWPAGKPMPTVTYVCPNMGSFEELVDLMVWLNTAVQGPFMQHAVMPDGQTLVGSSTMTMPNPAGTATLTSKWVMTALPPE